MNKNTKNTIIFIISCILILLMVIYSCRLLFNDKTTKEKPKAAVVTREVVSVERYIHISTNQYGGNRKEEVRYYFIWKNSEGELKEWKDFEENIYNKIALGDKDEIVFNPDNKYDGNTVLYLTEDTLRRL